MSHSILTVDDSKTVRMVVKRVFNQYDCVVREATNGEEGLVAAAQETPDVILLDITMPVMDGIAMLTKLRADSTLQNVPVIMLTAEHGQDNVVQTISLGVQDYLVKPFKDEQLREKVQKILPLCAKAAAPAANAPVEVTAAADFGRAAVPESIKQLGKLIGLRDAALGDYAQIISQDVTLADRLLRTTNARTVGAAANPATTVEDALQRVGITFMLVLAISDPLIRAVVQNVHSMLGVDLSIVPPEDREGPALGTEHLVGTVAFTGTVSGRVRVRLPVSCALLLRERLQGANTAESGDLVGPVCRQIFDTFESKLREAGLVCTLGTLEVTKASDTRLSTQEGWMADRYGFRATEVAFCADLEVNSHIEYSK